MKARALRAAPTHVWVIEVRTARGWTPAETVSLRPAVYLTRAEARRDLYNREIPAYRFDCRLSKYTRAGHLARALR